MLGQQKAAAPPSGQVLGVVVGADEGQPIAAASIALWRASDSTLVAGTLTGKDGRFRLGGVPVGRYTLKVSSVGFSTFVKRRIRVVAGRSLDLGSVRLEVSAIKVSSVTATAHERKVSLAPDRNTYAVRNLPTTTGGTVIDVLRNIPAVDVDIDNVVSLRGNSSVVVEINGRPTPMKGTQLGDFLAQLPADLVARVEIIPNPSARYEPDGIAGIINIVLKKKTDLGTGGGLNVGGGTNGQVSAGGDLGYQKGPLTFYGSYGFMRRNRPRTESLYRENLYTTPVTYLEEQASRTDAPLSNTLTGSAQYQLAPEDQLAADLFLSTRHVVRDFTTVYQDLSSTQVLTGLSNQLIHDSHSESNLESSLSYEHDFPGKKHSLTTALRFDRSSEGGPRNFTFNDLHLDGLPTGEPQRLTQRGWEHPEEGSLKIDYSRPLGADLRLEAGYKGDLQRYHTTLDMRTFDYALGAFVKDTAQSSDFTYDERIQAGYALLDASIGRVQLQGGIRAEAANTRFRLNSIDAIYDNDYNSIYPSALIAYSPDDSHQIKLSYSKRVRRPDDTDLIDPTVHYIDPLNRFHGNPYLQPEYIHSVELGLQRSGDQVTLQLTPYYRRTVNAVTRIATIDTAGIATTTFANVATRDAYGTDATVALHGDRLSGFAGASFFRQVSNAANLGPGLSARTFGWTARANVTLHLLSSLDAQTLLFYRGPMTVEQGRIAARFRMSLAFRQKLLGDRLGATLRVVDPFNTAHERFTTVDPRFYQVSDRRRHERALLLTLSYDFGKPPDQRKPATTNLSTDGASGPQ